MENINKAGVTSFESLGLTKTVKQQTAEQPKLGQEEFMKLMLTQMNNQDPFKPMEDGEFLTQMAQFSAVSGLKDIKDSFSSLSDSLKSSHALQASSMVGRKVLIPGEVAKLDPQGDISGAVELPASSSNLKIHIMDSQGQEVKTLDMGSQSKGMVNFKWDGMKQSLDQEGNLLNDGRAVAGNYTIKAEMVSEGKQQSVKTLVLDAVESVSLGANAQGMTLNLANGGSTVMSSVKQIF
ncbi:Flagellar basal-body rod modification protein FlgD [hydrothermal vent metagenome]|uniref:Flagellar basal-body rod modification protein FlgD n=1 Tax=hydrothermal vent metagenome TaxID=652676 RepID=A0A3B1B8G3_9ZZZZ